MEKLCFGQGIACTVHGDDFTAGGPKSSGDWYGAHLRGLCDFKTGGRVGPGPVDYREATCLNRVIRWVDSGLEYEADLCQAEKPSIASNCGGVALAGSGRGCS